MKKRPPKQAKHLEAAHGAEHGATYNHFMVLSVQSYSHQAEATCGNDSLKDLKIYRKGFHLTCADVKLICLMFAFKV